VKPVITVICPVRNMEGKLQNLQSWTKQCDSSFQIILVCDSSTDKTLEELQNVQFMNPLLNIEILVGEFGSPGAARNAGLTRAEGNWVTFWDSDDLGRPELLLTELQKYNENVLDAVVFGYEIRAGHKMLKPWFNWPNDQKRCLERTSLNPGLWRFCFKTSSIGNLTFPKLKMAEDQLFINDFIQKSPLVNFDNATTYTYFVGVENQLTSNVAALGDLSAAVKVLSKEINTSKDIQIFTIRILGKILITQMKKSQLRIKVSAVLSLIGLAFRHPREVMKLIYDIILEKSS
jgi:glycosyltransferase involved in cell wall biosynthesis